MDNSLHRGGPGNIQECAIRNIVLNGLLLKREQVSSAIKLPTQRAQPIKWSNEPCHEIMVLFVLRKLILQTRMTSDFRSDPSSTSILHVCEHVFVV